MAKGIVATLKEALLKEGVSPAVVDRILHAKTGRLYCVLDCMEHLIWDVAHRTRLLIDQGHVKDFQTVVQAVESLTKPMKNIKTAQESSESLKRELVSNTWIPAKKICKKANGKTQTYVIFRKKELGDRNVDTVLIRECATQKKEPSESNEEKCTSIRKIPQEMSGLDVLAEAAASCNRASSPSDECPLLAKLLDS